MLGSYKALKPTHIIDVKPSNILVNYGLGEVRFKDVQLSDFGSTVPTNSSHARDGDPIGTPMFRSPEAHRQMSWSTATDIWSFGATASFESKVCHLKTNFMIAY
jgi:serine/threonine protein kinase